MIIDVAMEIWIAIALALVHPASAHECVPPASALNDLRATHPYPVARTVTLNAEQTARVVAWYNAQPAVSAFRFNMVILVFDGLRRKDG